MQYWTPNQNKTATGGSPPITSAGSTGPNYANGSTPNLSQRKTGYLDDEMLGSDQWGTGASFQGAARPAMIDTLKGSFTNANPEDYAALDERRNAFRQMLSDTPTLENMGRSTLDTSMQRGLSNLLSQHKSANAGTGRLGSRQFAGQAGDITSQMGSQYNQGLLNLRNNAINQMSTINSGLESVKDSDLKERSFQNQQAGSLSALLERMAGRDQGREGTLHQEQIAKDNADKALWSTIITGAATAGGAALGGPPGAMAGSQLGSQMGPKQTPMPTNTGSMYDGGNGGYSAGSSYGMYDPNKWNGGYYSGT